MVALDRVKCFGFSERKIGEIVNGEPAPAANCGMSYAPAKVRLAK
jgi:hypothetical protein